MNNTQNPFGWKFSIGNWFAVQVNVSLFFPLAILFLCLKFGLPMGAMLSALLFISVLLHEFGHIWGARVSGGFGDEILIWPLGGLAMVSAGHSTRARLTTSVAGPAVNLILCLLLLPFLFHSPFLQEAFIPWQAPISADDFTKQSMVNNFVLLGFHLNLLLFALNMLPACPLDGGQMLRAVLAESLGMTRGLEWSIKTGFVVALLIALGAILGEHMLVLGFAFFLFISSLLDQQRLQMGEFHDDSFLGYDFSQGYTSLERPESGERTRKPGLIAQWREKRRLEKERRIEEATHENELQLDVILAKLHEQGMGSLTESEKRQLKRASSRYKEKDQDSN